MQRISVECGLGEGMFEDNHDDVDGEGVKEFYLDSLYIFQLGMLLSESINAIWRSTKWIIHWNCDGRLESVPWENEPVVHDKDDDCDDCDKAWWW